MGRIRAVTRLKVCALRNIKECDISFPPGNVLITGGNGAGKTSILEALYVAARGRTFRSRRSGPLTTSGESLTRVEVGGQDAIGIPRTLVYRRLGTVVTRQWGSSELTTEPDVGLRVRLVGENSQILLDGEPELRRRFVDWNLFHVEPGYADAFVRFRRAHWQRNAWLKAGAKGRPIWDETYVQSARELDRYRQRFVLEWRRYFHELVPASGLFSGLRLEFNRGWRANTDLAEELVRVREGDVNLGYTRLGPGRADFLVARDGARAGFSRGESKAIVVLLQVAANQVDKLRGGDGTVWLVDDLEADLDQNTGRSLGCLLADSGDQIFQTRVVGSVLRRTDAPSWSGSWFHVKQGHISPV
jgi:DNA replication and repair protein RecF